MAVMAINIFVLDPTIILAVFKKKFEVVEYSVEEIVTLVFSFGVIVNNIYLNFSIWIYLSFQSDKSLQIDN